MARRWTAREDATLSRLYDRGVVVRAIARSLGRSEDAVNARCRQLGMPPRRARVYWTPGEDALLEAATRAGLPATVVAERMRRRVGQVRARRRALGLSSRPARPYTPAEDALLTASLVRGDAVAQIARALGRSPDALRLRAAKLGVHRPVARARWSSSEDSVVRDGYDSGLTCLEIARGLPGRAETSIAARARKLGLATHGRRWTAADDARLRRLAAIRPLDELAHAFDRTPDAPRQRARRLRLPPPAEPRSRRAGARWTAQEDELLRLHAGLNPGALAVLLDRSDRAVSQRLAKLGLRAGRERSPHHPSVRTGQLTPGERALITRELGVARPGRVVALAKRLGVPAAASTTLLRTQGSSKTSSIPSPPS